MSYHNYQIFTTNLDQIKGSIDYFLAEFVNPESYKEIQEIAIRVLRQRRDNEGYAMGGYFSESDYWDYAHEKGIVVRVGITELLLDTLLQEKIIREFPTGTTDKSQRKFQANKEYAKFLYDRNLILNIICGWKYIIKNYSTSVFKIQHKDARGDFSIGTGFYCSITHQNKSAYIIVTNKHVLEGAAEIRLYNKDDTQIDFDEIKLDEKRDLGFIILNNPLETPTFHFNDDREVLSEILTIGYPSVPMTKLAYQIYHKGEVNSFVEDYRSNKLFLISAKTSSGNSGSPIIDRNGLVIGIVTEELFEKEQFFEKGKLPYYAGIPTKEIMDSVVENIFN